MNRITTIEYWWEHFNEEEFNEKLKPLGFGLTRSNNTDGYFEHYPGTNKKSRMVISKHCFADEDLLKGTILHEMLHQYQYEILDRKCNHDAVFTSMARRLERKYNFRVR